MTDRTTQEKIQEETREIFRDEVRATLRRGAEDFFHRRAEISTLDLSGLEKLGKQEIRVAFQAPDRMAMLEESLPLISAYAEKLGGEDAALQEQEALVDAFLEEQEAGKWTMEARAGEATVIFEEIADDAPHPVNLAEDEMDYMDIGDEDEVVLTINDRPFHFHNSELLHDHFAEVVQVRGVLDIVEGEGQGRFGSVVSIVEDDVASVGRGASLAVGRDLLELVPQNPDELLNTLRHERGHVVHDDISEDSRHALVLAGMKMAGAPAYVLELLEQDMEWSAERLADVTMDNEDALEEIAALDNALETLTPQLHTLAEQMRAYPWYDETDAMSIAADFDNPTSMIAHLEPIPMPDTQMLGEAIGFYQLLDPMDVDGYDDLDNDDRVAPLQEALEALHRKHAGLLTDLQEIRQVGSYISQAQEYLADLHSVRHAAAPEEVADSFRSLGEALNIPAGDEPVSTHPSDDQRCEAMGHFARRVLQERARQAQERESGAAR